MPGGYETDTVTRLETNLDDLSPEIVGAVMDQLFAAGALDVWFTPIQMKKNRPAVELSILCEPARAQDLADILFRETSAFGLRMEQIVRLKLQRRFEQVQTEFGEVTVKLGMKGDEVVQVAPEFESCRQRSEAAGQPLRAVYAAALQAFAARTSTRDR
jgi:pyridinium-3,5-bisthiocarboxylic acid mononucleotide nickel chelatase